jgi:hypothetical protein
MTPNNPLQATCEDAFRPHRSGKQSMNDKAIEIALHEYDRLAAECVARIGYRDNLIYVTLAAYRAIIAFVLHNGEVATPSGMSIFGLLVLPWVSLVLGWSYLTNDLKISEIGNYIRRDLAPRMQSATDIPGTQIFGYDYAHAFERHRKTRKRIQFLIDELTRVLRCGCGSCIHASGAPT